MFILGNKVTKCSLLNEMMGINDMDMNVYAEKLKSDRYGIFNIGSIAFHCASRPDFFNRMAMLVAKMKNDGCWDAYSVKGNRLEYDWKKDERFKAYATEDKSDMEAYSKAKGLYLAMAEQLENEHALNQDGSYFKVGDALPKAYTT
jgi:hypothetical protein